VSSVNTALVDDGRARRNAFVFSVAQALYGANTSVLITTGGLVGYTLADDKSLATLPISSYVVGAAIATIPAAFLMRKVGRRPGFIVGSLMGALGSGLCAYAIYLQAFFLFCLGTSFIGVYQAFAGYYRYAAADVASEKFRSRAVSWVLVGGIAAAILGPWIVRTTTDLFPLVLFAGAFMTVCGLSLFSVLVLLFVDIPHVRADIATRGARPLREILSQPKLLIAIFCCMTAFAVMNLVMTATPLAMTEHNHSIDSATFVIQWHIIGMFGPSFFTGYLIDKFGKETIIATGMVFLMLSGVISLMGTEYVNFWVALVFLGVGWNFGYIGGTTLVLDCYQPSERNKVQAATDFSVFALVALASFTSGAMLNSFGWQAVQYTMFPLVAIAFFSIVTLKKRSAVQEFS